MYVENLKKIIALRHELHAHPELSMNEKWTKQHLMEFIITNTSLKVVDCGMWFYAVYISKSPDSHKMAFRADFDALPIAETCNVPYISEFPESGHKCGHDGHSAALAGLALEIDKNGADNTIYFIFQHAEEIGRGGADCAELIASEGIDIIYAVHNRSNYPLNSIIYRDGLTQCASRGLTIYFKGRASHASQPEDGINPAQAIADTITYASSLSTTPSLFSEMVLCTIVNCSIGSRDFGISAGNGELSMTLRANREDELDLLEDLILKYAKTITCNAHISVSYDISDPFPETRNTSDAIKILLKACNVLGINTISMNEPWRASEDFGYYTKKCSGAMFYIGNGENYPALHTGEYDFNDGTLETIVEVFKKIINLF